MNELSKGKRKRGRKIPLPIVPKPNIGSSPERPTIFKEGIIKKGGVNPPPNCPKPNINPLPQNFKSESHSSQVQQGPIISNKKLKVNFSVIGYVEELKEFVKLLQVI